MVPDTEVTDVKAVGSFFTYLTIIWKWHFQYCLIVVGTLYFGTMAVGVVDIREGEGVSWVMGQGTSGRGDFRQKQQQERYRGEGKPLMVPKSK